MLLRKSQGINYIQMFRKDANLTSEKKLKYRKF